MSSAFEFVVLKCSYFVAFSDELTFDSVYELMKIWVLGLTNSVIIASFFVDKFWDWFDGKLLDLIDCWT